MIECPACSHRFHADAHHPPTHCPACGKLLRVNQPSDWTPVARLSNLADCGFFSDALAQNEIDARVQEIDEYSALLGLWEPVFVLQVAREQAARAAELINQQLDEDCGTRNAANKNRETPRPESDRSRGVWTTPPEHWDATDDMVSPSSVPIWKSVVIVLVAGGLAYGVGRASGKREAEVTPRTDRDMLWQALSRPGESFVTEGPLGGRKFRLRYDVATDRIQMDEDIDGDGRYDRRRTFDRGRLVTHR